MTSVYLSPHLDDAALSCGGRILAEAAQGDSPRVINLFAGVPDFAEGEFSPYAEKQHRKWNVAPQAAVRVRLAEDGVVLAALGAQVENWGYYDAIYRAVAGQFLYTNHQELFGALHPAENALVDEIAAKLWNVQLDEDDITFVAPLRVGGHVDHLVARACAIKLHSTGARVAFYEDFPYVGRDDWPDEPTTVAKAVAELPFAVRAEVVVIDAEAKVQALLGYRSQLFSLFGDWEGVGLRRAVLGYTARVAAEENVSSAPRHAERYWVPQG